MSSTNASEIGCPMCTFLNPVSSNACEMCGTTLKVEESPPPMPIPHIVENSSMVSPQDSGKENVVEVEAPRTFEDAAGASTSAESSTSMENIVRDDTFCPHCGARNCKVNQHCTQCQKPLRTMVDQIISDFHNSSNNFCREVGLNVSVVCPGCGGISEVPPQTVVKCSACSAVYETTSIGKSASFHLRHLVTSLSRSFSNLFSESPVEADPSELETPPAPIGILIEDENVSGGAVAPQTTVSASLPAQTDVPTPAPVTLSTVSSQTVQSSHSSVAVDGTIQADRATMDRGTGTEDRDGRVVRVEGTMVEL